MSHTFRFAKGWRTVFFGIAVIYSILHFWHSGIAQPNSKPFTGRMPQARDEIQPLVRQIREGGPVHSIDSRQYGPVFFFLMHPALLACGTDVALLGHVVYGMGLVSLAIAFVFCVLSIRLWLNDAYGDKFRFAKFISMKDSQEGTEMMPLVTLLLGLLWSNFSPVYYILSPACLRCGSWRCCRSRSTPICGVGGSWLPSRSSRRRSSRCCPPCCCSILCSATAARCGSPS